MNDRSTLDKLLLEIADCPIARKHRDDPTYFSPCRKIVAVQAGITEEGYQRPEPWSGRLADSPLLFLSSNPSIDLEEEYPTRYWNDALVVDFFENRFAGFWVLSQRYPRLSSGQYRSKAVRYWSSIRKRATELFGRDAMAGTDYVMTEIVHCKSQREIGVPEALCQCGERYLRRVLGVAAARVVVVVGRSALEQYNVLSAPDLPKLSREARVCETVTIPPRYFVWLPHPVAREPKTFAKTLSDGELEMLRAALRSH